MNEFDNFAAFVFGIGIGVIFSAMGFALEWRKERKKSRKNFKLIDLDKERKKRER